MGTTRRLGADFLKDDSGASLPANARMMGIGVRDRAKVLAIAVILLIFLLSSWLVWGKFLDTVSYGGLAAGDSTKVYLGINSIGCINGIAGLLWWGNAKGSGDCLLVWMPLCEMLTA